MKVTSGIFLNRSKMCFQDLTSRQVHQFNSFKEDLLASILCSNKFNMFQLQQVEMDRQGQLLMMY